MAGDIFEPHLAQSPAITRAGYEPVDGAAAIRGNRTWWDQSAAEYLAQHGDFLGAVDLLWCPEGLRETTANLLGDIAGKDVLEVGAGAANGARWAQSVGARVTAVDLSGEMLRAGAALNETTGQTPVLIQADAAALPLADGAFDVAFSAYGALPFVPDVVPVHREVARVLRPGGRWVFSVTHPIRWCFPDDPGPGGLRAERSYFDRTPYAEHGGQQVLYAEFHRTLGDHVRALRTAGFTLLDLVEPEWPADQTQAWDAWSPLRGAIIPGTAIFVCQRDQ